jgi:choline dehydrogenase-like flavoprotein
MTVPRFRPEDFALSTSLGAVTGASFADWPIDYPTLERFYVEIEQATGVQGAEGADADPFAPAKSKPYALPPGAPMYASTLLADAARGLGYHPFALPMAIASRPYRGRPACIDCGFCAGYGCPTHAKGSPAVTLLRDALLTGNVQLRVGAAVTQLVGTTSVSEVHYVASDGSMQSASADRYVLAAGAIESARLLLLSGGLGNSTGLVGRHLMFHHRTSVLGVLPRRVHGHRGRSATMGLADLCGTPNDSAHPLGGLVELAAAGDLIAEAKHYALTLGQTGDVLRRLLEQSPLRDKLVALIMHGEDAPQASNRIELDTAAPDAYGRAGPRITYAPHAFELTARDTYIPQLIAIHERAGAQLAFVAQADDASRAGQALGTLRMGLDPTASVCDRLGKLHDVGNLWCADGALFPTSSGFPPLLTIQALALWVAANIASPADPTAVLEES